jgi:hypothetical protein
MALLIRTVPTTFQIVCLLRLTWQSAYNLNGHLHYPRQRHGLASIIGTTQSIKAVPVSPDARAYLSSIELHVVWAVNARASKQVSVGVMESGTCISVDCITMELLITRGSPVERLLEAL